MTNIVERLRARKGFWLNGAHWMMGTAPDADCAEAAHKIEQLQATDREAAEYVEPVICMRTNFSSAFSHALSAAPCPCQRRTAWRSCADLGDRLQRELGQVFTPTTAT
jgi:hypothetical protein